MTMRDDVNSPEHYKLNEYGIECIDAIQASMTVEEFEGYLRGNVLKYMWRCNYKGHKVQDLQKAAWYLDKLVGEVKGREEQPMFNFNCNNDNKIEVVNGK